MQVLPISNNYNKTSFNGKFLKTPALKRYINEMGTEEFFAFQTKNKIMESVNDGKEYLYNVRNFLESKIGGIFDAKTGELLCADYIASYKPSVDSDRMVPYKESENKLFDSIFGKYIISYIDKKCFLNSLESAPENLKDFKLTKPSLIK